MKKYRSNKRKFESLAYANLIVKIRKILKFKRRPI